MSERGAALLLAVLLASLLAVAALTTAFMARTQLQLARNRALALQAEAVALSGAAVAAQRLSAAVGSDGALPTDLELATHPEYAYRLRSYHRPATDRAHFEIEGAFGGGRALVEGTAIIESGKLMVRLLR